MEEKLLALYNEANEELDMMSDKFISLPSYAQYEEAMRPYYKKVGIASRNYRLVKTPEFEDEIPDYGDTMRLEDFISNVKCGGFIDYDGYGYYTKDNKMSDIIIRPSDVKNNAIRKDFTEIVWFNK